MSEEAEFKSMRITISDEASARLEGIMKRASFRSYSSTVEECIRVVHDLTSEIYTLTKTPDGQFRKMTHEDKLAGFDRLVIRMQRITGITMHPP